MTDDAATHLNEAWDAAQQQQAADERIRRERVHQGSAVVVQDGRELLAQQRIVAVGREAEALRQVVLGDVEGAGDLRQLGDPQLALAALPRAVAVHGDAPAIRNLLLGQTLVAAQRPQDSSDALPLGGCPALGQRSTYQ